MNISQIINKTKGPCIVLAGAGTGKTHTIVEKVKHIITNKIYEPEKIACITFSNEATNSLKARIFKELGEENPPIIRTFHGLSADLLKEYGDLIQLDKNFKILEPNEAKISLYRFLRIKPHYCHKYIESIQLAKDFGISLKDIEAYLKKRTSVYEGIDIEKKLADLKFELQTLHLLKTKLNKKEIVQQINILEEIIELTKFVKAWSAYERLKDKNNYQDYSDLNINALNLLKARPEISKKFDYIIVDEFQDTNKIQIDLLFLLCPSGNITIVGDINQSIYGFRGAYKENFLSFINFYNVKKEDIFGLDKSRRSPNKILRAAYNLILNNYSDREQCLFVNNFFEKEGEKIRVFELKNEKEEARKVYQIIKEEIEAGRKPSEICVMFRAHHQGEIIRKFLKEKNIDFVSVTKTNLLKNRTIKTIIDYLNILFYLMEDKQGGEHFWWDLFYEIGFNNEDLALLGKFLRENKNDKNEKLSKKVLNLLESSELTQAGKILAKKIKNIIEELLPLAKGNVLSLLDSLYRLLGFSGESFNKEEQETILNLNKFRELVENHSNLYYTDLLSFLKYIEALQNLNIKIESVEVEKEGVRLMTLHSTKGLEYEVVILTHMNQGKFPIEKEKNSYLIPKELLLNNKLLKESYLDEYYSLNEQIREERRLCYVAFTRTKERLFITYSRENNGKELQPSQFLNELNYKNNNDFFFEQNFEEKYDLPNETGRIISLSTILTSPSFNEVIQNFLGERNINTIKKNYFSPSALLLFSECEKKYEFKYLYNMPDSISISWEEMRLGSFVHAVLEKGVKNNLKTKEEFIELTKQMILNEEWEKIDENDAIQLILIFFERNKDKYNQNSKTECPLKMRIGNFNFLGYADRIDFKEEGIEIIDYKTGNSPIPPKQRNWQLGYYALAAEFSGLGKVRKVTLDMLKHEKPLEFEIDNKGNAKAVYSKNMVFNIFDVQKELEETAKKLENAYKDGFRPCPIEKNCPFCIEWIYNKK